MARLPFLPKYADANVEIGHHLIEKMPNLAALIGRSAAHWSDVELQMSMVLGELLSRSPGAVAVFNVLRRFSIQRDVLEAVAKYGLAGEQKRMFQALDNILKDLNSQRDAVVHGVWGKCDAIKDGAIWCKTQHHAHALVLHFQSEGKDKFDPNQHKADYFIYKFSDLEKLGSEIMMLARAVENFHIWLRHPMDKTGAEALRQLNDLPRLREELARIKNPQENKS